MAGIANFNLLGAGCFCIPINVLELCLGDVINLLGNSPILLGFPFKLCYVGSEQHLI